MATTSFDKDFRVTDSVAIKRFKNAAKNPKKITTKKRNYEADKATGITSLKRKLLGLATA